MRCKPGSLLEINGEVRATASAVILRGDRALVLTAGHACTDHVGRGVQFFAENHWHNLGVVWKAKDEDGYDAAVIDTSADLVGRAPVGFLDPLESFPFLDLSTLSGRHCESLLAHSGRTLTGTVTNVSFDGSDVHSIAVTPGVDQPPGTNGDSGAPLIVFDGGRPLLAGIFVKLKFGQRVMQFLHPTPALNGMEVPIP